MSKLLLSEQSRVEIKNMTSEGLHLHLGFVTYQLCDFRDVEAASQLLQVFTYHPLSSSYISIFYIL